MIRKKNTVILKKLGNKFKLINIKRETLLEFSGQDSYQLYSAGYTELFVFSSVSHTMKCLTCSQMATLVLCYF